MRPFLTWLLLLGACSGSSDGEEDASLDVAAELQVEDRGTDDGARDAVVDTRRDVTPRRDTRPPWTSEWHYEMRIQHSRFDCDPWEPVEALPRGIPEGAEVGLKWIFRPTEDPFYRPGPAGFQEFAEHATAAPDGSVWVSGPHIDQVTQISPEGRVVRWVDLLNGSKDELITEMAATPEGGLLAMATGADFGARLFSVDEREPFLLPGEIEFGASELRFPGVPLAHMAVGPNGLVYVVAANQLFATCRGEYVMWTATVDNEPGFREARFGVLVEGRDAVVGGSMSRIFRITPEGEVRHEYPMADLGREYRRRYNGIGPEGTRYRARDREEPGSESWYQVGDARVFAEAVFGADGTAYVEPEGVTLLDVLAPPYTGDRLGQLDAGYRFMSVDRPSVWLDGGGWVGADPDDSRTIVRRDRVGEVQTTYATTPLGLARPVVTQQGVLFGDANTMLIAIQLDTLPPPLTECAESECNAYRDRWVRAAE